MYICMIIKFAYTSHTCTHCNSQNETEVMLGEIYPLTTEIGIALKNIDKWMAPEYVHKDLPNKLNDAYILPEPLGVVLNLSPWNYPLQLTLSPLIGTIAAGKYYIILSKITAFSNWPSYY